MGGGILNKNAFTLIELLAIIVILAIIAVITVPIILNIIDNSKKGAATDSAYGYKDAVQKYYVTELSKSENQNLILSGQYDVSTGGVLNGSGITNKEIPVSGDKPSAGELHYTNNTLQGGCLVIGDYQVIFDGGNVSNTIKGDCSDYEYDDGTLKIGDSINYSTTLNGVTLNNWKVFYIDGDYTYLIYGDYLPTSALNTTNLTGLNIDNAYAVYTTKTDSISQSDPYTSSSLDRTTLLNIMTTTSNWNDLVTNGKINGTSLNQTVNENIWAIGSPTIDLWINSWNATYPNDNLYTRYISSSDIDIDEYFYSEGYAISDSIPITNGDTLDLNSKLGYSNTLYFPYQEWLDVSGGYGYCMGYWLASLSSRTENLIVNVDADGFINIEPDANVFAFRPVIKLPTSVVNQ